MLDLIMEFKIKGQRGKHNPVVLNTAETKDKAETLAQKYRVQFSEEWTIWIERDVIKMCEYVEHYSGQHEPVIVAHCTACCIDIYDYELCHCGCCNEAIHQSCRIECARCSYDGCNYCFIEDDRNGEWYCGATCMEEDRINDENNDNDTLDN